jgi:RimJ/RimL family protein N-acetyltransferase
MKVDQREHWNSTVVLRGRHVSLEPLQPAHVQALREAARDGELSRLWFTSVPPADGMDEYIRVALAGEGAGTDKPFVVRDAGGTVVGCTRYCHMEPVNQRLEIGYTWYASRVQRTALNTEAKLLLLTHAFETLGCIAVEFRTNWFNHRSRTAIARLGAKQDGVLRNTQRMPGGGFRDTVVFSIIESEWPTVKHHLQHQLDRRGDSP